MSSKPFAPTVEQQRVICYEGSAFISACPGAGKTRVLVERARLLLETKQRAQGIAVLSFTRAAVSELETRLRQEGLLSSPPFPDFIGTFDSFLWQFMVVPLGIPGCSVKPRLIPDQDKKTVRPFPRARELPLSCFAPDTGRMVEEDAKRKGFDPHATPSQTKAYESAARAARARFRERGELSFDDARAICKAHLQNSGTSARLGAALAGRFIEIIVDEAQDCNSTDLEIIDWLRSAGISVKVICDPDHIYGFRGGVTDQLHEFGRTFAADAQLRMTGNFRSSENICKAVVALRSVNDRIIADRALGAHGNEPTPIRILSYSGQVAAAIGEAFHEHLNRLSLNAAGCPVLAATREAGAKAIGQSADSETSDLTLRLALAITSFHFSFDVGNRITAADEVHKVVLAIEDRLTGQTYHQYLAAEGISPASWRPRILELVRDLRYDPSAYPSASAWHARAKQLLAPHLPAGQTISKRLRNTSRLQSALSVPPTSSPPSKTIHSVKGMEFAGVCVVMTAATAKGILDFLQTGAPTKHAENARKIYVAASRAQRLLAIAVPRSQANRLAEHLGSTGAQVSLISI